MVYGASIVPESFHPHPRETGRSRLITIEDLAALWQIPKATLYNWVSQGKVPHLKIGRLLRFDLAEIEKFETRSRMGTATKR